MRRRDWKENLKISSSLKYINRSRSYDRGSGQKATQERVKWITNRNKNNNATTFKLFVTFFTEETFSRGEFRSLLTFPDRVTWKALKYRAVVLRSGSARALIRNSTEKNIKIVHIRFVFQFSLVSPSSRCSDALLQFWWVECDTKNNYARHTMKIYTKLIPCTGFFLAFS